MSEVLIGHSYFLSFDPKPRRAMQPYPPVGTLYAAALLREAGHQIRVFDAMLAENTGGWAEMLAVRRPDVAVLFEDSFNYLSKMCLLNMRAAAFEMIRTAKATGCPVIVCGSDVTDNSDMYLSAGAGYAIIGEGDGTVVELVEWITKGGQDLRSILGLKYRSPDGDTVFTGPRSVMRDLDTLPVPARGLVNLDAYKEAWRHHGQYSMNLVASRGCSFHCNWCAKPIWGQHHNVRSPASVAEEIEILRGLGAEHLWFMDDIFGLKPGWLAELAEIIEAKGLRTPFKCLSRADLLLRHGEIDALQRAGCETVWIGAESGSQKVLDAMEKGTTVEQVREVSHRLQDAGIRAAFFLQFGYPGEQWDDIQATFQLVRDCEPADIGMSVSYPLPGTPFNDRVKGSISKRSNWVDSDDMAMLFAGPYSTAFYRQVHRTLHTEFRIRKASRDRSPLRIALNLLRRGRIREALSLARDYGLLPIHRARMEIERRRSKPNHATLPALLSRLRASTPSRQDDP